MAPSRHPSVADAGQGAGGRGAQSESFEADERSREALAFTTVVIVKMDMECDVRLQRPRGGELSTFTSSSRVRTPVASSARRARCSPRCSSSRNRAMNRPGIDRRYVTVDADGYSSRRDDSLASMARRLGKQAVSDGQIITFEPMSPRDRRVVHLALAEFEGVVTKSEGEGDDRRVQIIPVRRG